MSVFGRRQVHLDRDHVYGHSAGARIGRGMNYTFALNRRACGSFSLDAQEAIALEGMFTG
jgi:hypothetical protein